MLVCRVIAGRVSKRVGLEGYGSGELEFDSASGENGELLVFDSRAVLPCFLVIYKFKKKSISPSENPPNKKKKAAQFLPFFAS